MPGLARLPLMAYPFIERCQAQNLVGRHAPGWELVWRARQALAIRSGLKRLVKRGLRGPARSAPPLGAPSVFEPGAWVRVRDAAEIRATLDPHDCLRGLLFVPQQWAYCGGVFLVRQRVRRIMDDRGGMRPVARTVLLEGPTCAGVERRHGCGRLCPLFFRDEWLEPAAPPPGRPGTTSDGQTAALGGDVRWARVRSLAEIGATLDARSACDGLRFMPDMVACTGRRVAVAARITSVFELGRARPVAVPVYALEGLACSGTVLGPGGPCDRGCTLLWHERWLELEAAGPRP